MSKKHTKKADFYFPVTYQQSPAPKREQNKPWKMRRVCITETFRPILTLPALYKPMSHVYENPTSSEISKRVFWIGKKGKTKKTKQKKENASFVLRKSSGNTRISCINRYIRYHLFRFKKKPQRIVWNNLKRRKPKQKRVGTCQGIGNRVNYHLYAYFPQIYNSFFRIENKS